MISWLWARNRESSRGGACGGVDATPELGGGVIMRVVRRNAVLIVAAAVLAALLAACGGGSDAGESKGDVTRYDNAAYDFSLSYREPLSVVTMDPPPGEVYSIAFADTEGTLVKDQYANGLRVSVLEVDQAIKAADVPKLQETITPVIEEMIADLPGGKITGEVAGVTVNGTPGYVVDYESSIMGEAGVGRLYVLIKRDREYHLTLQAVTADWESIEPVLEEAVQTFTLE